ncbi:hypothetical protein EPUL_005940 [Erysiphe pulchra]|uniref:GBD/FH3 domain-containing protein n=1 Tax=Erysiphe pulchra TaxID=225359 RepID=A0A2S4PP09_9PEZI|nr:hypothetical protein EPUL_005940 [Erysiphe pulchra]
MSSEFKQRSTPSGMSLFSLSRSRQKHKRSTSDEILGIDLEKSRSDSSKSTRSARHTRNSSSTLSAEDRSITLGMDQSGINMIPSVITSISYESITADMRSPISVEFLPRGDQMPMTRRDPQLHQISKTDGALYSSGNRSNVSMALNEGKIQQQHRGPTRVNGSNLSVGQNSKYDSFSTSSTAQSSTYGRNSSDHSSLDSTNERSSVFSTGSSRTGYAITQQSTVTANLSPHIHANRDSNRLGRVTSVPQSILEPPSPTKPNDDRLIEEEFLSLMQKRGWHNLPEQARRQMMAYPPEKKWTLVYQDRLTEYQGEQKRRAAIRGNFQQGQTGRDMEFIPNADEEGTPEWFVKKVMQNNITAKQLQSLAVSLRTQPIGWVQIFIECQGQIALTNVLGKINRRQAQGPVPLDGSISEKDHDREYEILKCLKALMNNRYGADDALAHQQVIVALASSLISPRLTSRKLVSEILTFLCHWGNGQGHLKVIQALDFIKTQTGENGRFDAWMRVVEVTIDGRGKMGSLVGASDELRNGGIGMENLLMEYAVATLLLINMIVDAPEKDLQLRVHIRAQFMACGIKRILTKMEAFQYEVIDKQVERFRTNEIIDYEDLLEHDNNSNKDSTEVDVKDLNDPNQIVDAIMQKVRGSRTQDYFISSLQHLLLIRNTQEEEQLRMFQLVDSMLTYVAMDRRLPDMDLKQSLNFTVRSLLDKLHTDSEARQALDEAMEARQIASSAMAERDEMKAYIELGADGLVAKLQKQIEEQSDIIHILKRQTDTLKSEIENMTNVRAKEVQQNELETRELYLMLRDAQDVAMSSAAKVNKQSKGSKGSIEELDVKKTNGIINREKLMDRLEMQIERQKTQLKLEGRLWADAINPSDRLRALREEMEANEAESDISATTKDYTKSTSDSLVRQVKSETGDTSSKNSRVHSQIQKNIASESSDTVILNKTKQSPDYLDEMKNTVKKYDASEDEDTDNDGTTTGASHPSIDSNLPKTPTNNLPVSKKDTRKSKTFSIETSLIKNENIPQDDMISLIEGKANTQLISSDLQSSTLPISQDKIIASTPVPPPPPPPPPPPIPQTTQATSTPPPPPPPPPPPYLLS